MITWAITALGHNYIGHNYIDQYKRTVDMSIHIFMPEFVYMPTNTFIHMSYSVDTWARTRINMWMAR